MSLLHARPNPAAGRQQAGRKTFKARGDLEGGGVTVGHALPAPSLPYTWPNGRCARCAWRTPEVAPAVGQSRHAACAEPSDGKPTPLMVASANALAAAQMGARLAPVVLASSRPEALRAAHLARRASGSPPEVAAKRRCSAARDEGIGRNRARVRARCAAIALAMKRQGCRGEA